MPNEVNVILTPEIKAEFAKISDAQNAVKNETLTAVNAVKAEIKADVEKLEEKVNLISISQDSAKKEDKNKGFKNHIEFFNAVIEAGKNGNRPDKMPENLKGLFNAVGSDEARKASNPDGGFLVPPAFLAGLLTTDPNSLQTDTGAFTRQIPMTSDVVYLNARVDKNHANSVTGGFRVYRREEAATVEASKATFEQVKLEAKGLMGLSYATEEILARSPISFAALISDGFASEKTSKLNYERIWGTGVGEYLGYMNSDALVTVAKEGSQSADTILGANLMKMRARIYGYNKAVWLANQDTLVQLAGAHIAGTHGDVFLFAPGNGIDKPDTILGRPVIFDENMATLGDLGDLSLVNFSEYLEATLGGASFMESVHVRFVYNERAFKFTVYNDGAPWWKTVLTPKKSASTLSPFVTLAVR